MGQEYGQVCCSVAGSRVEMSRRGAKGQSTALCPMYERHLCHQIPGHTRKAYISSQDLHRAGRARGSQNHESSRPPWKRSPEEGPEGCLPSQWPAFTISSSHSHYKLLLCLVLRGPNSWLQDVVWIPCFWWVHIYLQSANQRGKRKCIQTKMEKVVKISVDQHQSHTPMEKGEYIPACHTPKTET